MMENTRLGGFLISKIHQLSGRVFARMLTQRHIQISPAQGRILFVLWMEDEIPIHELAQKTSLGKSTLTRMLDRMEAYGYLFRKYSESDRRVVLVCLTEENKKMKTAYQAVSLEMTEIFYKDFSEAEIDQFEKSLNKVLRNLSKQNKQER